MQGTCVALISYGVWPLLHLMLLAHHACLQWVGGQKEKLHGVDCLLILGVGGAPPWEGV